MKPVKACAPVKVTVFVLAALLAALAGWLFAHFQRSISPTAFGLKMGIEYLFMAVIGGVGHVWGALVGALFVWAVLAGSGGWLATAQARQAAVAVAVDRFGAEQRA